MLARLGRHPRLLVTFAFVLVAITVVLVRPPMVHWSPDGDGKYLQMTSIRVVDGRLKYDVPYVGNVYDPHLTAVPLLKAYFDNRGGEIHLAWPELFVLLSLPLYKAFGWLGLFILPLAGGAASVQLTGAIAERIRRGRGWIASLVLASATPLIVYSTLFWEHTPALALSLSALWLLVRFFEDERRWRVLAAGALMGFASAALRGELGLLTAALVGATFLATPGRRRWWVPPLAVAGFVLGSVPGWAMNYIVSGRLLPSNAVKSVPAASLGSLHPAMLPNFFAGKGVTSWMPAAAWTTALVPFVLCAAYYVRRRRGDERRRASVLMFAAFLLGATSLAEMPSNDRFHGWLAMCPVLALGTFVSREPLPEPSALVRRMVLYAALLYAAIIALALGLLDPEEVDLEWGPRYWIALFPLTTILVAVSYDAFADALRPVLGGAALVVPGALFFVGVAFIALGMKRIHTELTGPRVEMRSAMRTNGPEPLLTDAAWMSPIDPEDFTRRPSFYIDRRQPAGFSPWLCEAAAHGLTSFDLVTYSDQPAYHPFLDVPPDCDVHVVKEDTRVTKWREDPSRGFKFIRLRIEPGRTQRLYGTHRLYGLIYAKYAELGEENSYLGSPISDELSSIVFCTGGRYVKFQHGRIDFCPDRGTWDHDDSELVEPGQEAAKERTYRTPKGAHRLYGLIYTKYAAIGEQHSYLGVPISDEMSTNAFCLEGRYVKFENGRIDFCPDVGAWAHSDPTQEYPGRDR